MEKWEIAYQDYRAGRKYKEIADRHGVSVNTVKSWASRKWKKLQGMEVAETVATHKERAEQPEKILQPEKKQRGAPKGNKNASGNKGGAPEGNKNAVGNKGGGAPEGNKNNLKHGIYEKLLYSALSEEEKALFQLKELDRVEELKETIRLCDIQIMRFMRRIREAEEKQRGLLTNSVTITGNKYYNKDLEKLEFSNSTTITNTIAAHNLILKYNDAIEKVKRQKIKCLEDLRIMEDHTDHSGSNAEITIKIGEEDF